ncbi:MAG: MaoC family dehydratase [Deltaproteobacteria bacterium]|nr:MaoC family dehydratase [Deltaproteobacteria bacterium]
MDFKLGKGYHQLRIGEEARFTKTITETDVYLFAGISGDFNPMHVNEAFAKKSPFKTRIAHGGLAQSLIAPVLGMKLPGLGTIAVEISCRFKAPVFFGDTVTAAARVVEKIEKKQWVRMALSWTNQHGTSIAEGEAVVMPPPDAPQPFRNEGDNMDAYNPIEKEDKKNGVNKCK